MSSSRRHIPRSTIRIECYIPERFDQEAYDIAFDWLCDEFTYAHGGCSAIQRVDGRYRSTTGLTVRDRITLVWCDLPWQWTVARERAEALTYAAGLRDYLSLLLPHEEVMYVVLVQVFLSIEHK